MFRLSLLKPLNLLSDAGTTLRTDGRQCINASSSSNRTCSKREEPLGG